jgi:hypothetical protein
MAMRQLTTEGDIICIKYKKIVFLLSEILIGSKKYPDEN